MSQSNPTWLDPLLYKQVADATIVYPVRPTMRVLSGTVADNPAYINPTTGQQGSTDITPGGGGPTNTPITRIPVVGTGGNPTINATAFALHDVNLAGGPATLQLPAAQPSGTPLWVKFKVGNPGTNALVVAAPVGASVQHPDSGTSSLSDAYTATYTFNQSLFQGATYKFMVDANGNWDLV